MIIRAIFTIFTKVEATSMPTNPWLVTKMWHNHKVKFKSAMKKWSTDICYNTDGTGKDFLKEARHSKNIYCIISFIGSTQNKQIHRERKQISTCQGLNRGRNGEWLLNGHRISVWGGNKGLELNSDASCTTVWMYLMPLNCTFYNG